MRIYTRFAYIYAAMMSIVPVYRCSSLIDYLYDSDGMRYYSIRLLNRSSNHAQYICDTTLTARTCTCIVPVHVLHGTCSASSHRCRALHYVDLT